MVHIMRCRRGRLVDGRLLGRLVVMVSILAEREGVGVGLTGEGVKEIGKIRRWGDELMERL